MKLNNSSGPEESSSVTLLLDQIGQEIPEIDPVGGSSGLGTIRAGSGPPFSITGIILVSADSNFMINEGHFYLTALQTVIRDD